MKKVTAKVMGYKIIDEFNSDISSIVYLKFEDDKIVKVVDEFGINIASIVKIVKC